MYEHTKSVKKEPEIKNAGIKMTKNELKYKKLFDKVIYLLCCI
jgi:hypothetical protein